jgi:hypothetical protein
MEEIRAWFIGKSLDFRPTLAIAVHELSDKEKVLNPLLINSVKEARTRAENIKVGADEPALVVWQDLDPPPSKDFLQIMEKIRLKCNPLVIVACRDADSKWKEKVSRLYFVDPEVENSEEWTKILEAEIFHKPESRRGQISIEIEMGKEGEFLRFGYIFSFPDGNRFQSGLRGIEVDKDIARRVYQLAKSLNKFAEDSKKSKVFFTKLRDFGSMLLYNVLFEKEFVDGASQKTNKFEMNFLNMLDSVGHDLGRIEMKWRFGKYAFGLPVESLYHSNEEWLQLKMPMVRVAQPDVGDYKRFSKPLFSERKSVRSFLIVQADFEGGGYDSMPHAADECRSLVNKLEGLNNNEGVDYHLIKRGYGGDDFRKQITDLVEQERKFDIVHFAGHSGVRFDKFTSEYKAFFVFPPLDKDPIEVGADEFCYWLRRLEARFVFLSSCHSSEEIIVHEMVERGVPAMLGYCWDLDDTDAAEFCSAFYDFLFELRKLGEAFKATKKKIYDKKRDKRIWTSAILMLVDTSE